jgi:hypothetical protein
MPGAPWPAQQHFLGNIGFTHPSNLNASFSLIAQGAARLFVAQVADRGGAQLWTNQAAAWAGGLWMGAQADCGVIMTSYRSTTNPISK